jgi:hypothetical protein
LVERSSYYHNKSNKRQNSFLFYDVERKEDTLEYKMSERRGRRRNKRCWRERKRERRYKGEIVLIEIKRR